LAAVVHLFFPICSGYAQTREAFARSALQRRLRLIFDYLIL